MSAQKWFKFYGQEYLSDPKIERLSPTERSCWITLLCIGSLTDGLIRFLTIESLLQKSGIQQDPYHQEEWDKALGILQKFESLEMVEVRKNGDILIKNWEKRQETNLTGAERVRNFRERQKSKENKGERESVTHDVTKVTLDKNRLDKNRLDKKDSVSGKFRKPTLQEVQEYCKERGNTVDPQRFIDHYESNGWKVGGRSAMKDWKASVRTWEKNRFNSPQGKKPENVLQQKGENKSLQTLQNRVRKA